MFGQSNYETIWNALDGQIRSQQYKSAHKTVSEVIATAKEKGLSHELLIATYYEAHIAMAYQEDPIDSSTAHLEAILPLLNEADQAVCHSILAHMYSGFKVHYSLAEEERQRKEAMHREAALANTAMLQKTDIEPYIHLCRSNGDKNYFSLTPTLYDMLMREEIAMTDNARTKYDLLKQLADFHKNDNDYIRIYIDKELLAAQDMIPNGVKTTIEDWKKMIEKYKNSKEELTECFISKIANMLYSAGHYTEALEYCNILIERHKKEANSIADDLKTSYHNLRKNKFVNEYPDLAECVELRHRITLPHFSLSTLGVELAQQHNMTTIKARNVSRIYCRVTEQGEKDDSYHVNGNKIIKEWTMDVDCGDDYHDRQFYIYIPPLPEGRYLLMVSATADFKENGLEAVSFECSDVVFLSGVNGSNSLLNGYLVNGKNGTPIANASVVLERYDGNDKYISITSTKTKKDGWYKLLPPKNNDSYRWRHHRLKVTHNGHTTYHSCSLNTIAITDTTVRTSYSMMLDRPVYKPGEEVHYSLLIYRCDRWKKATVVANTPVTITMRDINSRKIASEEKTTNDNGIVYGSMKLPDNCLPGSYRLEISSLDINTGRQYIKVEAYKQPTYTITLQNDDNEQRFNQVTHLSGDAISYSQVPINDAKVSYTIERRRSNFWWWYRREEPAVVASGETTTDANGHFSINFTPEPDTNVELDKNTIFIYTLHATVTDLNGETHEQTLDMRIGYSTGYLTIDNDKWVDEFKHVSFRYQNLDRNPISDKVHVVVERLKAPEQPLLKHPHCDYAISHSLSRDEFAQRFPSMAYDAAEGDMQQWPVAQNMADIDVTTTLSDAVTRVPLQDLPDGVYRIRLSAVSNGDTISDSKIIILTSRYATRYTGNDLLWSDVSQQKAVVGDLVHLRIGSRHKNVQVYIAISDGNGGCKRKLATLDNSIQDIQIPISDAMLGGCTIRLIAVKDGIVEQLQHFINVEFRHKELDLTLTTLRDHLTPGSTEQWTLQIKNKDGIGTQATSVMTMFDAALNNYGSLDWHLWPWRNNRSIGQLWYDRIYLNSYDLQVYSPGISYQSREPLEYRIIDPARIRDRFFQSMLRAKGGLVYESMDMMTASAAPSEMNELQEVVSDASVEEEVETEEQAPAEEVKMRENLNTLAFFEPCLTSDAEGNTSVTFTLPDVMTQWEINALSFTNDIQVGSLLENIVSRKEIMVTPMVPRFMRQGDILTFAVKVSNLTEQEQNVIVSLEMTNIETGSILKNKAIKNTNDANSIKNSEDKLSTAITVPAGGSQVALFELEVPTDCYAVQYKAIARTQQHNDGEQGIIPVLSNRQMVTESQAMYVNGSGEKSYTIPSMTSSDSREPRLLAVEFTANPIWLAIQSLPYVSQHENPSNIYLFNQYFCNKVAQRIVEDNPSIKQVVAKWQSDSANAPKSRLSMNEDLKQTMMEETPWLQDAENEEQRIEEIANYFDQERINNELEQTANKIKATQNDDGGWSWIPDGEYSSVYTTRYMLRLMGSLSEQEARSLSSVIDNAMEYIDQQAAIEYQHYKEHNIKDVVDAEFLYIHSCYPDIEVSENARAAYNYYMANAKKQCLDYTGLYSRAQLAIIMSRADNDDLAEKLIKQLKECSLESDEMGMYWRDNVSGFLWNEHPIEVQAMLIKAFSEVTPDDSTSIALMRQWLLKQKQTTSWKSDIASVAAITALLEDTKPLTEGKPATITVGQRTIESTAQAGTGYVAQRWKASDITPDMNVVTIRQHNESIGWGAAYWQYVDDLENIESMEMGISIKKSYLLIGADGKASELRENSHVKVGDRVRVQLLVSCDRHLEYLELKEGRPAGFEPVSSASGWRWNDGLRYYAAVTNTAMHIYIDRMDKGKYVISYDLFATQAGNFGTGLSVMQSLYAPEFRAIGAGRRITVD